MKKIFLTITLLTGISILGFSQEVSSKKIQAVTTSETVVTPTTTESTTGTNVSSSRTESVPTTTTETPVKREEENPQTPAVNTSTKKQPR